MKFQVNRNKTQLHDFLVMAAIASPHRRGGEDELRPEIRERIQRLREQFEAPARSLEQYKISDRFLFFNLLKQLPSSVETPKEYISAARDFIDSLDGPSYLKQLARSLDLDFPDDELASIQSMLQASSLEDHEKWAALQLFSDPKGYLNQMLEPLENLFQQFVQYYPEQIANAQAQLAEYADQQIIEDFELIAHTFTQDLSRFECIEIVPTLFQPYSAGLFIFEDRVQAAIGIQLAESIRQGQSYDAKQKSDFFKNLSDSTRYKMLTLLAQGDYTNKQLADALGVTAPNITYHFRTLLKDGLVKIDLDSERPSYRINHSYFHRMLLELIQDLNLQRDLD